MIIRGKLTKLDLKLVETAFDSSADISAKCGASHLVGTETVKVYSEGYGDWYLFGGHLMRWGLIQADSWGSAYEIYLEQFVPCDEPDDENDLDCGFFDSCGGWYSELTTSYVVALNISDYDEWEVELTEGENYDRQ